MVAETASSLQTWCLVTDKRLQLTKHDEGNIFSKVTDVATKPAVATGSSASPNFVVPRKFCLNT